MKQRNAKEDWLMLERKLHITSEKQDVTLDSTDIHFEEIANETSLRFTEDLQTANLIEGSGDSKIFKSIEDSNALPETDVNQVSHSCYDEAKDFVCSICSNGFTGEKQFYGHLRVHTGEVLWKCTQCSGCSDEFESQSKLKIHENLCHYVVRPFKCHLCGLVFDRASQLDYHQRSVHLGEKSQVCQICGKGFFRRTDLRTHLNIHLGTNLCICEICGRKFNHMSNLIRHGRTHAGVKPYPCMICGKRFTQISSLTRHKRIHSRAMDNNKEYSFKRQHKVEVKSKGTTSDSFKFINNIKMDGDRVIKRHHYCKICGESFQFMLLLRQHEKYHLENVETLECKNCGKKFQSVREIKEHSCQESVFRNSKVEETDNKKTSRYHRKANNCNSTNLNIQNNQAILVQHENNAVNDIRCRDIPKSKTTEEALTEGTIVCVTSEQLANINLNQVEDNANHFLHEHLMELTGKINTVSTGLDLDANMNVSEILGTYSCETIELSNAVSSYPRAYQIQSLVSIENNDLESKENVIYVQTLEKDGLAIMSEDGNIVRNITFDLLMEKDKKNLENSCMEMTQFQNSGSIKSTISAVQESYILESVEEKINKEKNNVVTSNQENVDNVQNKTQYLTNVDNSQSSEIIFQSNRVAESSKNNKDSENINSDHEEPTLRLVQTENGEQFYELIINNLSEKTSSQSTKNSESSDRLEERLNLYDNSKDLSLINDDDPIEELNMKLVQTENVQPFFELVKNGSLVLQNFVGPTQNKHENHGNIDSLQQNENEKFFYVDHKNEENPINTFTKEIQSNHNSNLEFIRTDSHSNFGNYEKTNFEVFEKTHFINNTDQFFEFAQRAGNSKEVSVHKEQSFEIIQDPVESDKATHLEFIRTSKVNENNPNKHSEIIDNLKGNKLDLLICDGNNLEFQTTTSVNSDFARKKEDQNEDKSTIVNLYIDFASDSGNKISTSQTRKSKTSVKKFQCTVCNKSFSTSYNFKQHIGTHFTDQQKFKCKECRIPFAWKSTLNKHMATHHRADGPQKFVCEICPKVYSTLSQVNEHVKRDHLKERNHVCPHCGKSFFKKFDLKTHSRTHTKERPYVCRACGKGFHHQSHIIRHERIHSGERPYSCDICQRTFTQLSSLKVHKQRHREIQIDILDYRLDEDDPLALSTL